jgi:hypothetical protein
MLKGGTARIVPNHSGFRKRNDRKRMQDILAGSFAVRQSKTILARSVKRERAATANDPFVIEHSNEALVEKETTAYSAKTHEWVKLGPNHFAIAARSRWSYGDI